MKTNSSPHHNSFLCSILFFPLAMGIASAVDITGDTVTTDLTVNGNTTGTGFALFQQGVDFGSNGEASLSWWPGTSPAGTVTFDINWADGTFTWRDDVNLTTASNKMILDAANSLTLYRSNGTEGITLTPETGRIILPAGNGSSTGSGIYFGTSSIAAIAASSTGTAVFNGNTSFVDGISISSNVASTSSTTGALTVAGGIGVAKDSWVNGIRIGRGAGNIGTNTSIGALAVQFNSTGVHNTATGYAALRLNTTGNNNTANGSHALLSNTTGSFNTASGVSSLYSNTTGGHNAATGSHALNSNTTGSNNSALGVQSLGANTTGANNSVAGKHALGSNITGGSNIAIGSSSGRYQADGTTPLTDPENSIYIGANSKGFSNSDQNSIVIGNGAVGAGANTTVIGNSSTTTTRLYGETISDSLQVNGLSDFLGTINSYGSLNVHGDILDGSGNQLAKIPASAMTVDSFNRLSLLDTTGSGRILLSPGDGSTAPAITIDGSEVLTESSAMNAGLLTLSSAIDAGFIRSDTLVSSATNAGFINSQNLESSVTNAGFINSDNLANEMVPYFNTFNLYNPLSLSDRILLRPGDVNTPSAIYIDGNDVLTIPTAITAGLIHSDNLANEIGSYFNTFTTRNPLSLSGKILLSPGDDSTDPAIYINGNEVLTTSSAMDAGFLQSDDLPDVFANELNTYLFNNSIALSGGHANVSYTSTAMSHGGAYGSASTAMSYGTAVGHSSTAMSYGVANGDQSFAAGKTEISSFSAAAFGHYNENRNGSGSGTNWDNSSQNSVFEIGIGSSSNNRSNALTVLQDGSVEIGKNASDRSVPLQVKSDGSVILAKPQGDISMGAYQ